MTVSSSIQQKKKIFELPYDKDQLEYLGPVNHSFADSFVTMGHSFIYQYFKNLDHKLLKSVFSSFVEMVQNVSEYNEESFKENYPQSYLSLKDGGDHIYINTINKIKTEDKLSVQSIFEKAFSVPEEGLQAEYKRLLFEGKSLGLIMLRKLINASVDFTFSENDEGEIWLSVDLKIRYGNT